MLRRASTRLFWGARAARAAPTGRAPRTSMLLLPMLLGLVSAAALADDPLLTEVRAYPNPVRPLVENLTLDIDLREAARLEIHVYDWNGDVVASIHEGDAAAGENLILWDGRAEDGRYLANGVYLIRVVANAGDEREDRVLKIAVWND